MRTTVQEQFIVDTKSKKTGIILSLNRYQRLMEDLHDLAVVAERRAENPISLQEMKQRLKKDGILCDPIPKLDLRPRNASRPVAGRMDEWQGGC